MRAHEYDSRSRFSLCLLLRPMVLYIVVTASDDAAPLITAMRGNVERTPRRRTTVTRSSAQKHVSIRRPITRARCCFSHGRRSSAATTTTTTKRSARDGNADAGAVVNRKSKIASRRDGVRVYALARSKYVAEADSLLHAIRKLEESESRPRAR